ncbi:MAG: ArsR family transcriptional regulator [Bacteroidetes bacterium]|nr:ArsR family transcriptional regulator [Bacteroidota bacterium]
MIETLISSKTRVKLLLKFFLNSQATAYLRNLEEEFGESTNAIRLELNKFEEAKMLTSEPVGKKKVFRVNTQHPLFKDLHNIILKYVGLDKIVEHVIRRLGSLEEVYLTGNFARGLDGEIIDLVFVGNIDKNYLGQLVDKAEGMIHRRIRYIAYTPQEFSLQKITDNGTNPLLLWSSLKP